MYGVAQTYARPSKPQRDLGAVCLRAHDLEYRSAFEIARRDIAVIGHADLGNGRLDRQDGIAHQRKGVRKEARANKAGGAFGELDRFLSLERNAGPAE